MPDPTCRFGHECNSRCQEDKECPCMHHCCGVYECEGPEHCDDHFEPLSKTKELEPGYDKPYSISELLTTARQEAEAALKEVEQLKKTPANELREMVADIHNQALSDCIELIKKA